MKKIIAIMLSVILALGALSACSININLTQPTDEPEPADAAGAETQAAPVGVGSLSDYVRTAREVIREFSDGNTNTLRLPELLLSGDDAAAANKELSETFGDMTNSGMYALDYEACLSGSVLSLVTTAKYDGGNSDALCCNFDVITAERLDSEALCAALGYDHDAVVKALKANLADYYEEKYASIPGNDTEREKTLSDENLREAALYLSADGKPAAIVDIYAAVGGGHWVAQLDAEP